MHLFKIYNSWKNYPEEFKDNLVYNALLNLHGTYMLENEEIDRETRGNFEYRYLFEDVLFYFPKASQLTELNFYKDFFLPDPDRVYQKIRVNDTIPEEDFKSYIKSLSDNLKKSQTVKEFYNSNELEKLYYVWKSELFFSFHEIHDGNCNLDLMENLQWVVIDQPTYYWIGDDENIQHCLSPKILQNIESNKNIKGLMLRGCKIRDVEFLKKHNQLIYLNLEGNRWDLKHATAPPFASGLKDITSLSELKNLEKLNISNTYVNDLTALANIDTLKELICLNIKATLEDINELQKNMPNCKIIHNANEKQNHQ